MRENVLSLIKECASDVAQTSNQKAPVKLTEDTLLFGSKGLFDSIGLATFVVSTEQALQDKYNVTISLADQRAMSQTHSPFHTLGTFAEYVTELLKEVVY